jgi:hypothetical protein
MDENELRDALARGHESIYATSPTFRAHLDTLVALLPLWVRGMAAEAQAAIRDDEYRYIEAMRAAQPLQLKLRDISEEEAQSIRQALENAEGMPQAVWRAQFEPPAAKLTWRERAEQSGAAERARQRMKDIEKEPPMPVGEFDAMMERNRREAEAHLHAQSLVRLLTAQQREALTRHDYDPDLPPRGIAGPPGSFTGAYDIQFRNRVCELDGIEIDGHEGSDLDPGSTSCIHCDYEGPNP